MSVERLLLVMKARQVQADAPVPSPCLSVCRMDMASALCEGCLRTLDEIAAWSGMDEAQKRAVWRQIEQRAREASP